MPSARPSATSPTRLKLTANPPIAMASGSPAATTEPNMMSRITTAAIRPIISTGDWFASASCTARPPSAIFSPPRSAAAAAASSFLVSSFGMSLGLMTSR
jgi:hypothetical protein